MALIGVIDNEKGKNADGKALPLGIMKQLNSSCMSGSGTDQSFLSTCKQAGYDPSLFENAAGKYANEQFILVTEMRFGELSERLFMHRMSHLTILR